MRCILLSFILIGISHTIPPYDPDDIFSCFALFSSRYLQKSGTLFLSDLGNITSCLKKCSAASELFGFTCKSAMWRKDSKHCVLSKYGRGERKKYFKIAPNLDIDLYENICRAQAKNSLNASEHVEMPSDNNWQRTTTGKMITIEPEERKRNDGNTPHRSEGGSEQSKPSARGFTTTPTPFRAVRAEATGRRAKVFPPVFQQAALQYAPGSQLKPRRSINALAPIQQSARNQLNLRPVLLPQFDSPTVTEKKQDRAPEEKSDQSFKPIPIRKGQVTRHYFAVTTHAPLIVTPSLRVPVLHPLPARAPIPLQVVSNHETLPQLRVPEERTIKVPRDLSRRTQTETNVRQADRRPCFKVFRQRALMQFEETSLRDVELRACLLACLHSTKFYCASLNYDHASKLCVLNGGNMDMNDAKLVLSSADYYENTCNPADSHSEGHATKIAESKRLHTVDPNLISRCFQARPNNILLSFDSIIIKDIKRIENCLAECALSTTNYGRPCAALNWIPSTNGCMLFAKGYDLTLITPTTKGSFYTNACVDEPSSTNEQKTSDSERIDYYDDVNFAKKN